MEEKEAWNELDTPCNMNNCIFYDMIFETGRITGRKELERELKEKQIRRMSIAAIVLSLLSVLCSIVMRLSK